MSDSSPFILVDGSSYLFRAYYALPDLTNSKGLPTGAIHGVVNMLRKLQNDYAPTHMAVIFDAKGPTFRHELYSEYKANRPPMPEDLAEQIEPLHEMVRLMGLPLIMESGVEADDVIGTLARQADEAGIATVVSTGDKDMAQLVTDNVTLIDTMNNRVSDRAGVIEKFGVPPERIIDYLALVGDKVDNIPGVYKCGPKTAVKWLTAYDSMQGVMDHADEVKGKIGEYLREALEQLPLSYELATIKLDVPMDETPQTLKTQTIDTDALRAKLKELEFSSMLRQLEDEGGGEHSRPVTASDSVDTSSEPPAEITETKYHTITDAAEFDGWVQRLAAADLFAFDTETTSLDYMQAEIVGVSFAIEVGEACYVPCGHDYPGAPEQLTQEHVLQALKPLLEDAELKKVLQNYKYDGSVLHRHGIQLRGVAFDTMLESYVLNSTGSRHDMDSLAKNYLGLETVHFEDIAGKGAKQITFNQVALEEAGPYAAEDADITLRLHQLLWPRLQETPELTTLFNELELPLADVIGRIERTGVLIDADALYEQSAQLAQRIQELEGQAHDVAGRVFNLGSPKQLQQILFEEQELPVIKKTPKGQPSTAEDVLEQLADEYPLPKLILEFRGLSKLKSTYTDKLPLQVSSVSGRVHTSYHQAVAATGRLSSSDPNLQNIPVRSGEGRRIRQAFIAAPGNKIMAADYSQIELRIMAHLSDDPGLLKAFAAGEDIHKATAAEVFDVALADVTTDQRRSAKAINFGLIYGMSAFGLAKQLGITRGDAQEYVDRYFERYPGVLQYMERTRAQAHEQGYVETLFGRRLYLSQINARNGMHRQAAERAAINAPMQGTAADIIKRAMIAVDGWLQTPDDINADVKMIMQVHDELVFEVPEAQLSAVTERVQALMSAAADLKVPLLVDAGIGDNWDEAH